jgi:hypothetical protein
MTFLLRLLFVLAFLLVAAALCRLALKSTFPLAWERWLRRAFRVVVVVAAVALPCWFIGRMADVEPLAVAGATSAAVIVVSLTMVLLSAPAFTVGGAVARRLQDPGRRAFLTGATVAVPSTAALAGPAGAVSASTPPRLQEVEVKSALVPPALDGLKILQLSDVHLGTFIDAAQVRLVVDAAKPRAPHLVVLTGDIADDYELLPPALAAIRELAAPLGMFASIGNHEIYRGRDDAIRLFEDGGARFLCNDGVVLEHAGARIWLAGVDDPARLRGDIEPFLEASVARCMERCPDDVDCRIVLSHRPKAFDFTSTHGVALQLSGHTHGAQMALFGRSLLEGIIPMDYLLGLYHRGDSVLYTTAGLGHWFPFRLNCPPEAALVTLRSA